MSSQHEHEHDSDESASGSEHHQQHPIHEEHEEGGHGDEPWLVSYADLMTLLFGFFVLMYTFASKEDPSEFIKVKKELSKHFGTDYITEEEKAVREIKELLEKTELKSGFTIIQIENGLEVHLSSGVLFKPGESEIQPQNMSAIHELVTYILTMKDKANIEVEGHTDNTPISNSRFPSNWELSGGRSATLLRILREREFPGLHLKGILYGEERPLVPNEDEQGIKIPVNQAKNRRIVVRILYHSLVEKKNPVEENSKDK